MQILVHDLAELAAFAERVALKIPERLVVLLQGEPGAGKTEFVKALVAALDAASEVSAEVSSPTFAFHHHYLVSAERPVEHWDLYRLESEDDLESVGFWDQFSESKLLVLVEWPERLRQEWIPQNFDLWTIQFLPKAESVREVLWTVVRAK